jgi:preprotein translocase subunit YajC
MNNIFAVLVAVTTTTSPSSKSTSGSSDYLLFIVVLLALFYFLFMRPNQRRRMQAARQARTFQAGDEVVAAGMVGHVVSVDDGEVEVEVADGVVLTFVQQAVQSRQAFTASQTRSAGGRWGAPMASQSSQSSQGGQASLEQASTDDVPDESGHDEDKNDDWASTWGSDDEGEHTS